MTGPTERTGAAVLADMLAGYEVSHVFMVPAVLRRTFAELERRHPQIERVVTHGEKSAVYMADGYARASGRPGVCAAQVVGALNLAAGLREPWLAHSPVIALTGGRLPETKFKQAYQEVDDVPAFEPVTKLNVTVDDVSRFPDLVRQAFRVATTGTPGPVHLQFQGNEGQIDGDTAAMEAEVETRFSRIPPYRPAPDPAAVDAALEAISRAERPVFVAGGGARMSGAGPALMRLADRLGVPVATSANGRDVAPSNHNRAVGVVGTYSRESANLVVGNADLVVFVGSAAGGMTTHFWSVPAPGTRIIQIDIDPEVIGRAYPVVVSILGDARATLDAMLVALDSRATPASGHQQWLDQTDRFHAAWVERYRSLTGSDEVPIRPERLSSDLTSLLPSDALVVVDTGHAGMWMAQFFDLTASNQGYIRSAGHLGWAFPAGLGAKCAQPDRPTIVFTGDAGLFYHLGELETAVRRGINAVVVVNNNLGGTQSKRGFDRAYGGESTVRAKEMWTYADTDFVGVAEAMGALGVRVDEPRQLQSALDRAVAAGRPAIIDVRTDVDAAAPLPVTP